MEIELIERVEEAPNIYSYFFRHPSGFTWKPGDYVELSVKHGQGGDKRWFTIASIPAEGHLRFTMKYPPSPSLFKRTLANMKAGDSAWISPPIGNFNLPRLIQPLLFVGIGVGVTPYRSMLKSIEHHAADFDIELVYSARPNEYLFTDLLEANAQVHYHDATKPLVMEDIEQFVPDWSSRLVYFAGAQNIAEVLHDYVLAAGHPRNRLKLDYFPDYWE